MKTKVFRLVASISVGVVLAVGTAGAFVVVDAASSFDDVVTGDAHAKSLLAIKKQQRKDGKNMARVVKYLKANKYSKAKTYNRKLGAVAQETCVAKMSTKMKAAYRKVVQRHAAKIVDGTLEYMKDYYLSDVDNDGRADLIISEGAYLQEQHFVVYRYKGGKAKKVKGSGWGFSQPSAYPNHKGFLMASGHTGSGWITYYYIKSGRLKSKDIYSRESYNYPKLRCVLKSHASYSEYGTSFDYSDLW